MAFSFFGNQKNKNQKATNQVVEVDVTKITPNRFQPRKVFEPNAIKELAETIQEHGLLQPIIIREFEPNKYEIIAGERRFRAVSELQWDKIPAIIEKMNDKETASLALIENLQREQLSSVEEAQAYRSLMELNHLTQTALAQGMGKSQSAVANKLRLLKLITPVQNAILDRRISERHGRALLELNEDQQRDALMEIVNSKFTVKQTEDLVAQMTGKPRPQDEAPVTAVKPKKKRAKKAKGLTADTRVAVNTIKKSVKLIRDNGMKIKTRESDEDDHYEIVIEIPKQK
ncbi:nucleoid occlusion protein [Paucilactobacillus wasatchensis]|uniref:Chromosome (Plasmid) partitioning protein/ Stage 0 sporulation protein J n=1 Tax=Paucilactobacillus wasatchensis TaxID=1335616 RepID=A0A0D0YYR1_9LACO|nr:nucleoid occlusion protein [Paucilactobacillus wasatchensis]KIS04364.1 Chromosome (plasmid) partitioning protein/ Stage 0 sporulation protein J [Paucilactobacillus wasatchensis]